MVNILWLSRHKLNLVQINDLKRIYGEDIKIDHVELNIQHGYQLKDEIKRNDIIAIVAPPYLQKEILEEAKGKPVVVCKNTRAFLGKKKLDKFIFNGWYQLEEMDIKMSKL